MGNPIILVLFLNFTWPPLVTAGKCKGLDWAKAGSAVIQVVQSTQTQINMATSVRSVTSEKETFSKRQEQ